MVILTFDLLLPKFSAVLCEISHRERHFKLRPMDLLFKPSDDELEINKISYIMIESKTALHELDCKTLIFDSYPIMLSLM